ncbi:MAG: hypothetical protein ABFD10_13025 [Prolixibacteraceae bacterium]
MPDLLVATPVKDSIETTLQTIRSVHEAGGDHRYIVFNDFSTPENRSILEKKQAEFSFELINLEDLTNTLSPNYHITLQKSQEIALSMNVPLVLIESDVVIKKDTLTKMLEFSRERTNCGMLGAVTTDEQGRINFPYLKFKRVKEAISDTSHSLSFCCTLISTDFLKSFSFYDLSIEKDWYDIFISRKSRSLGFHNYLVTTLRVIHKPHSSRPWKLLKYNNPIKYYFNKFVKGKDRI